jgi:hypothetical protein
MGLESKMATKILIFSKELIEMFRRALFVRLDGSGKHGTVSVMIFGIGVSLRLFEKRPIKGNPVMQR